MPFMKNKVPFILAILTVVSISCNSLKKNGTAKNTLPGTWQSTPIVIDGDNKDWPSPYPNYDAKAKIGYATSNDGRNLYITMQTGDEMAQVKILKQGMIVSIDTGGQKEAQFTIVYPMPNDNEALDMNRQESVGAGNRSSVAVRQMEQKLKRMTQEASQFSLEGFPGCSGGFMAAQTAPCGIKVCARMNEFKELVWEAVIPFTVLFGKESMTAEHPVSVCFTVKGLKGGGSNTSGGNTSPGMNDGMGGAGRNSSMQGGSGTGRPPLSKSGVSEPMQFMHETTKTWKHFGILAHP